ncbi:MAG: polysulfide reductase NrfD [Planctomycetaceae bacterium]|nr:polysulfide reductase NrfD [Planctomycetaceae bacterium]
MPEANFVFPNDVHPAWSIMIVLYPYITGLVAGAFVVSALYHVFRQEALKPVARLALVTSLCFCAFATVPLLLHLHHPERCFQVMITPSVTSAIAGFGFIYSTYMLLLVVEVWLVYRPELVERAASGRGGLMGIFYRLLALGDREITPRARAIDNWLIGVLAMLGIPIACVLHAYVGFLFGAVKSNPWWSTSLMPVIFLVSAIVSGIAALILLYQFICWRRGVRPDLECVRSLCRYLWIFLVLAVTLETLEVGQMAYESGGEWHILSTLITEHLAISYGLIQVLIGSVAPLLLLLVAIIPRLNGRATTFLSGLASLLVLVQVFAMRWNIVVGGQLFSKSFRGFIHYEVPLGGREGIVAAGTVLALPLLALWFATKIFPVCNETNETKSPQLQGIQK